MNVLNNCLVCENIEVLFRWEYDVLAITRSGMIEEYEVKISRSDFKADKKKGKIQLYENFGMESRCVPNYFAYVCPDGLISVEEVPSFAGLFYYKEGTITCIKSGRKLHKVKHDIPRILQKIVRVNSERTYLGCCRLTYENKLAKARWENYQSKNNP